MEFWQLWSKTNQIPIKLIPEIIKNNFALLRSHKVDLHVGLFSNDERKTWGEFSMPIHKVDTGVYFRNDSKKSIRLINLNGQRVAVQRNTFQQSYLQKNYPKIELVLFDESQDALLQLLNHKIVAIVSEVPYMNAQIAKIELTGVFSLSDEVLLTNEVYGFIPKGSQNLRKIINNGIKKMSVPKIVDLERKWLPQLTPFFNIEHSLKTLTQEEQSWLNSNKKFRLGIDHEWSPFEYVDSAGQFVGAQQPHD